jgi:hypothetical protein
LLHFKQQAGVAAAAFLSVLSLAQAQTNPAPPAQAQSPQPIKPADNMVLSEAVQGTVCFAILGDHCRLE